MSRKIIFCDRLTVLSILSSIRAHLADFYIHTGRPSGDELPCSCVAIWGCDIDCDPLAPQRLATGSFAPRLQGGDMPREIGERTVCGLWDLIGELVDIFQRGECGNDFSACGYDPE